MPDWALVGARFALYIDLGLLFGLPLFAAPAELWRRFHLNRWCALLAGFGIVASLVGFQVQLATMSGTGLGAFDPALASAMLTQTALGMALILRLAALAMALLLALLFPAKRGILALFAAVALGSLAWSGHAATGEGGTGWIHLAADILHLLAASAWIGALVMLLVMVTPRGGVDEAHVTAAHAALSGFSHAGTLIVAVIVATGILNGLFLLGASALPDMGQSAYFWLLLIKLMLFAAMLGCAALNRFRLTPRLAAASSPALALRHLRRSIAIETALSVLILTLVAWLGTLAPPGAG